MAMLDVHKQQEAIMFQVLDHAIVVYIGELSETTQYVIEHYGKKLDEAIRSGIRIAYADPRFRFNKFSEAVSGGAAHDFRKPVEDWKID